MSRFAVNVIANVAGQGWSILISLAFIPLYIKFLGIEAYGLIGFYTMLQGLLQVLDFGLSPTMNRELARYAALPGTSGEARDFVRTLEVGYWLLGFAIGWVVWASAPFIAIHWVKARAIPVNVVQQAVMMMGVVVALQWPLSFYGSGLMGLQRQVLFNSVVIAMATLGSGGAALILWKVSPTITAFFAWQVGIGAIQVVLITFLLWRSLPHSSRPAQMRLGLIRNIWRFSIGMGGLTLSGIVLAQLDKAMLSNMLSLEMFGYYMLAGALGRGLCVLITPVFNAIFPRFSLLVAEGDTKSLKELYHLSSQLMVVLVLPLAAVVALFSDDILRLWIGNAETAHNAAPIASMLVIGTALNGLMNLPYALQLAYGWTRIGLYITTLLIFTLVPVIVFMTTHFGAVGAAAAWVLLNVIYMVIGIPLTHRRLLRGEARRWCLEDIGLPLTAALLSAGLGRWLIHSPLSPMAALGCLPAVLLSSLVAALLAASRIRAWLLVRLAKIRPIYA